MVPQFYPSIFASDIQSGKVASRYVDFPGFTSPSVLQGDSLRPGFLNMIKDLDLAVN